MSFTIAIAVFGIVAQNQQGLVNEYPGNGKYEPEPEMSSKLKKSSDDPTKNLISASTYGFAAAGSVGLEDMSTGTTLLVGPDLDDNASVVSTVTYSGTGTVTSPMSNLALQSNQGFTIDPSSNPIPVTSLRVFGGNINNANKIIVGSGGATAATVQIGNTTTPTPAGVFNSTPTFNPGSGGIVFSYLRTASPRSIGPEIPESRAITTLTFDENDPANTHTLAGGDLTVTGTLNLTNGRVITNSSNVLVHSGTVARTAAFIDGPLRRELSTSGAYTFHVGDGVYSPATMTATAVNGTSSLTIEAIDSVMPGMNSSTSLSRHWKIIEAGDITADLQFTYGADAVDVNGNEADYRVYKRDAGSNLTNMCPSAPCVNTGSNIAGPVTGVTDFAELWSAGEIQAPPSTDLQFSGKVLTANGLPIRGAVVVLSGGDLPASRLYVTNTFGYFVFTGLTQGQAYTYTTTERRYAFTPSSGTITMNNNVNGFTIIAN